MTHAPIPKDDDDTRERLGLTDEHLVDDLFVALEAV